MAVAPGYRRRQRRPVGGGFDGTWNVVFITRAGNCSSNNSFPFGVSVAVFRQPEEAR